MTDRPGPAGIVIRPEAPGDAAAIRALTDAAFAPSTDEGRIVDALRADPAAWLPALSLVAIDPAAREGIVGHVVSSVGHLHADGDPASVRPMLGLGPISVAPDRQGQGIGSGLMHGTIQAATTDGWPLIVLLGHADYYPRFGFEAARTLGLEPPQPWGDEHWMARRLPGWTPSLRGTFCYPAAFGIDACPFPVAGPSRTLTARLAGAQVLPATRRAGLQPDGKDRHDHDHRSPS